MKRNDATAPAGSWAVNALLALGGWLVVSPLALSTTQVTACLVSAVTGGLALLVLAGWARVACNRVPPLAIACSLGLWLLLAPSMWEFGDGVDSDPGLVPINPSEVTEPTRAILARAEWNSILAGLLILLLAGSVLLARRRRQDRSAPTTGGEPR
jgi:LPXTG-motif cell wall-anchored protein